MNETYSNRELDSKFANLLEHMKGFETNTFETLERIEQQTTKTNGRVNKLETDSAVFRARVTTAIGILAFIVGSVLIPLIGSYISAGKL